MNAARVVEYLSLPLRLDRRGKGMTRHLSFTEHTAVVLAARRWFLPLCGGLPKWTPVGCRTVNPQPSERHSRPLGKEIGSK